MKKAGGLATLATIATMAAAGTANADATYTVCTAERGCATDAITLGRGQAINWCVDGASVLQSVSTLPGAVSFNDALEGLANLAYRSAEAVRRDGLTVVGFEARMDGCDGSWAEHCTAAIFGDVANNNITSRSPNDLIGDLSGQRPQGCTLPILGGATHDIVPLHTMGIR